MCCVDVWFSLLNSERRWTAIKRNWDSSFCAALKSAGYGARRLCALRRVTRPWRLRRRTDYDGTCSDPSTFDVLPPPQQFQLGGVGNNTAQMQASDYFE